MRENTGSISDGYHTFDELYEHRIALFCALGKLSGKAWMSDKHSDGSSYDGWFVTGLSLLDKPITYHASNKYKRMFLKAGFTELDKAPPFDGHTPNDVVTRLQGFCFDTDVCL